MCPGSLHPFSQMDSKNSNISETIWEKKLFLDVKLMATIQF